MFHVGQRVVCVSKFAKQPFIINLPVKGCVYTIRSVVPSDDPHYSCGLLLDEIHNGMSPFCLVEWNFAGERFRPVKDTSIEVFRKLLAPMPEKADA